MFNYVLSIYTCSLCVSNYVKGHLQPRKVEINVSPANSLRLCTFGIYCETIGVCFHRNLFNMSSAFTKCKCLNFLSVSVSNFWLLKRCGYWIKIWKYFHAAEWQVWRRAVQKFIHWKLWRYFIKDASWKLLIQSCKWNHLVG